MFTSNNVTTYDPNCPHPIGTDGNEMWEHGTWSMTWQVKGGEPVQGKGYHASVAVLEDGAEEADARLERQSTTSQIDSQRRTPVLTTGLSFGERANGYLKLFYRACWLFLFSSSWSTD